MISTGCIKTVVKDGCHITAFSGLFLQSLWRHVTQLYFFLFSKASACFEYQGVREKGTQRNLCQQSHSQCNFWWKWCLGYISIPCTFIPISLSFAELEAWHPRNINPLKWNKEMWLKTVLKWFSTNLTKTGHDKMLFHAVLAEGDIRNISSYYTGGPSALEG